MRQSDIIEEELIEIAAMADDGTKLEQIIAWCATHPDEIPYAIRMLLGKVTVPKGDESDS